MLEPDQATALLQPLPKPPVRSSDRLRIPRDALPPPLLGVEVQTLTWPVPSQDPAPAARSGPRPEAGRRTSLYVVLSLGLLADPAPPDDLDLACSASGTSPSASHAFCTICTAHKQARQLYSPRIRHSNELESEKCCVCAGLRAYVCDGVPTRKQDEHVMTPGGFYCLPLLVCGTPSEALEVYTLCPAQPRTDQQVTPGN